MSGWQPLVGPLVKLERAAVHIKEFEALSEAFLADNPYTIKIEKEPETGYITGRAVFHQTIPASASAIAGDIIHNLRSSLDQLVSDMIRASGNMPSRNSGFPIFKDETGFKGGAPEKLKGADERFVNFVLRLHSYGERGDQRWFYDLARLNNDDKHILLLSSKCSLSIAKMLIYTNEGIFPLERVGMLDGNPHYFPGEEVFKLKIQGKPRIVFQLRSEDDLSYAPALMLFERMHSKVGGVLRDATTLFS